MDNGRLYSFTNRKVIPRVSAQMAVFTSVKMYKTSNFIDDANGVSNELRPKL